MKIKSLFQCAILMMTISPSSSFACAVCYGAPNSQVTKAMDMAILFLLGVIFFVLGCIGVFVVYLKKRQKMFLPPYEELVLKEGME